MKLFPNFTSIPFDYLLLNFMGDELRSQSWIFDIFILDRIDRELHSLRSLELKFGLSSDFSEFVRKQLLESFLMFSLCVYRFSRASFNALTSSFIVLKLSHHLSTETNGRLPWQLQNYKLTLKFRVKIKE